LSEVRYPDLMSESSLAKVGLIFLSQDPEEDFVRTSLVASDDDDGMGMLGSMLDLASQQLGAISLKSSRPSEEGTRFSSPPPTPGTTIPGDEYHLPEGYLNWFDPPFSLDPSRSYFNDIGFSSKIAANILTPTDAELLKIFEVEKYYSTADEFTTKVKLHVASISL